MSLRARDIVFSAILEGGVGGVPETFVIDGKGRILHQHIGAVTPEDATRLVAMLGAAR